MNSSPERRCWPSCARAANANARSSSSRSTSGLYASTSAISSSTRCWCRSGLDDGHAPSVLAASPSREDLKRSASCRRNDGNRHEHDRLARRSLERRRRRALRRVARLLVELDAAAAAAARRRASLNAGCSSRPQPAQAASRQAAAARRAARGTSPTRAGSGRPSPAEPQLLEDRAAPRGSSCSGRPPLGGETRRGARGSARASRRSAGRRAAATPFRSSGSPGGGTRGRSVRAAESGRAARRPEGDRAAGRPAAVANPEAEMLAVSDRLELVSSQPARAASRRDCRGRTARAVAAPRASSSVSAVRAQRRRRRHGPQIVVVKRAVRVRGEGLRERVDLLGPDREPGGRPMAAEALEMLCARRRAPAWRSKRGIERPEPFQSPSVPAISTTGRRKRSTRREATMPITPSCQSSPAST